MDIWGRLRQHWRLQFRRTDADARPLIKYVPPAVNPLRPSRTSGDLLDTRSAFNKPFRTDSYIPLEDHSPFLSTTTRAQPANKYRTLLYAWIDQHKLLLACSLPLASVLFETIMLSFFLYKYVSLSPDPKTGLRPRLNPLYSIWPFVSCVGATTTTMYHSFVGIICIFSVVAVLVSFYLDGNLHPGYWLRRFQLFESLTATVLFIWLIFASEQSSEHTHLYIVSTRLLFLFGIKSTSVLVSRGMRNAYPILKKDRCSSTSFYWKIGLIVPAFCLALLANVGVFSCRDPVWVQTRGTTCFNLIAAAAIADWLYSMVNIAFLLNFSYDLYYDEHYVRVREGLPSRGSGLHLEARRIG